MSDIGWCDPQRDTMVAHYFTRSTHSGREAYSRCGRWFDTMTLRANIKKRRCKRCETLMSEGAGE